MIITKTLQDFFIGMYFDEKGLQKQVFFRQIVVAAA